MPPPVVTDATTTDAATLLTAAALFLPVEPAPTFTRCTGGVNNVVFYVDRPGHARLILRIYNNGRNTPRVAYEHAVLRLLSPLRFSFATPRPLPARSDGATFAMLPSGVAACVTECIPGCPAENGHARAIGRATAELVAGMASLRVPEGVPAVNPLYRNFWDACVRYSTPAPRGIRPVPPPPH
jgi:Ser/Thr protein kinase RdoA (MazF antagonist)